MIKAILWDIDSTLLDPIEPERNAIRKCFADFGFGECPDDKIVLYPEINKRWWDKLEAGLNTKEEITEGRFTEFLALFGIEPSYAKEFNKAYMERLGDTICPNPNAIETVKALRGKVKQYIVTNGLVASQKKKLVNSELDKLTDGVFISEDVGYDKPAKEFFDYVMERIGIHDRDSIMIVGDSLSTDMRGGNNAKIICCWYNPNHNIDNMGLSIDYEIDDIARVLDLI